MTTNHTVEETTMKIGLFTDNHVLPRDYIKDTPHYRRYLAGSPKLLTESEAVSRKAMALMDDEQVDTIFHIGDLTKDGEHVSHQLMASLFEQWMSEAPNRRVLLIPGNHDVNNDEGMNYNTDSNEGESLPRFIPADFRHYYGSILYDRSDVSLFRDSQWYRDYRDCVNATYPYRPDAAKTYAHGDLSYVTRLTFADSRAGMTVFGLDSNNYSPEVTDAQDESKETNGSLSAPQLSWFLDEVEGAKQRGDLILVLSHHATLSHFYRQDQLMGAYVINNWDMPFTRETDMLYLKTADERLVGKTPKDLFTENKVAMVFSGHSHVNSVSRFENESGKVLYDVTTASTIAYPSSLRFLTIKAMQNQHYQIASTMREIEELTYLNRANEYETVPAFWQRGARLRFDAPFIRGASDYFFEMPAYQLDIYRTLRRQFYPGLPEAEIPKAVVNEIQQVMEKLPPALAHYPLSTFSMLGEWQLGVKWSDQIQQQGGRHYQGSGIVLTLTHKQQSWTYFVARDTLEVLVRHLLEEINGKVLADLTQLKDWLVLLATQALAFPIGPNQETLEQLVNFLYLSYQYGEVTQPEWVYQVKKRMATDSEGLVREFFLYLDPVIDPIFQQIIQSIRYGEIDHDLLEPMTSAKLSKQVMTLFLHFLLHRFIGTSLYQTLNAFNHDRVAALVDETLRHQSFNQSVQGLLEQCAFLIDSLTNGKEDHFPYAYPHDRQFTIEY